MQVVVQKDTKPSTSSSIDQYLRDQLNSYRSNPSNNFKLVSASTGFTVSGQPAYQLVFTYTITGTGPSKQLELGILLRGQAYPIDYYGGAGLFPKFLSQAQQIIKSLVVQSP